MREGNCQTNILVKLVVGRASGNAIATFILIPNVYNYNSTANRFGAQDNRRRLLCDMDIVAGKVLITFLEQLFLHIWY